MPLYSYIQKTHAQSGSGLISSLGRMRIGLPLSPLVRDPMGLQEVESGSHSPVPKLFCWPFFCVAFCAWDRKFPVWEYRHNQQTPIQQTASVPLRCTLVDSTDSNSVNTTKNTHSQHPCAAPNNWCALSSQSSRSERSIEDQLAIDLPKSRVPTLPCEYLVSACSPA